MLIDWLTLRRKITDLEDSLLMPLMPYLATKKVENALTGELISQKLVIDIDAVRSDFNGMVWSISTNGSEKYLNIGASPASLMHGNNLFDTLDYHTCKNFLIEHARQALTGALILRSGWQPRRIDVTQNYFLQSNAQVKDALFAFRAADGIRQKATIKSGDTVYFGAGSKYRSGKAYDKYMQALELNRIALKRGKPPVYTEQQLEMMVSIIRLELTLGRQYFDEHPEETELTEQLLTEHNQKFFAQFIGSAEVKTMDDIFTTLKFLTTEGKARAALNTYLRIKEYGFAVAQQTMPRSTFMRHKKLLMEAGLSQSDLTTAKIIPFRTRRIDLQPVSSWQELEKLFKQAA